MKKIGNKSLQKSIATVALAMIPIAALSAAPDHQPDKHPKHENYEVDAYDIDKLVASYESVSAELVEDELEATRSAASSLAKLAEQDNKSNIANAAGKVADAGSLDEARNAFKSLSSQVIVLAKGDEDYTVMTCPMVESARWLQSDETVSNPYMGQKMPRCGMPESKRSRVKGNMDMKQK